LRKCHDNNTNDVIIVWVMNLCKMELYILNKLDPKKIIPMYIKYYIE